MIEHALNANNDLFLNNGQIDLIDQGAQVLQHTRTRLLFYLGEWFLNVESGTPWFQEIFRKPVNLDVTEFIIKSRIIETDGVAELMQFSLNYNKDSRTLEVFFSARTIYNNIISSEVTINA